MRLAACKMLKGQKENWKLVWFFHTRNCKDSEEGKKKCSKDVLKQGIKVGEVRMTLLKPVVVV